MSLVTLHADDDSHTGPSNALWGKIDGLIAAGDRSVAFHLFDDFLHFGGLLTSTAGQYASASGNWVTYQDSGDTVTTLATEVGGVVRLLTDTTDNDEVWMASGNATGVLLKLAASAGKKTLFETRFRCNTIASRNLYLGFSEEGCAVADTITDAGALVDKDFVGFDSLEGDATGLDFIVRKSGGARTVISEDLTTLVADTWVKLGFCVDYDKVTGKRITIYLDGVAQGTYGTGTQMAAATFPADEELGLLFGIKNGTTAATSLDLDWVRVAQIQ
jgi:hypothetical protein